MSNTGNAIKQIVGEAPFEELLKVIEENKV